MKKIGEISKMQQDIQQMAIAAKKATAKMSLATTDQKNKALRALIENIRQEQEAILIANREDMALARSKNLDHALLERLSLEKRLEGMMHDIAQVISLADPVGGEYDAEILPNQLQLTKCRTPLGVLGVIYESRPNVTIDIAALSIKSGNCALLRGGSETLNTNRVLQMLLSRSLDEAGLPRDAVQSVENTDRSEVLNMLQLHEYIDLIIPRGSAGLQQFCRDHSKIPVVTGGIGICHLFVDESADIERSLSVIFNAKTQRPTVCNALDTLLVHQAISGAFIPKLVAALSKAGVSFRLDAQAMQHVQGPCCTLAEPHDWDKEWLSLVLGVKIVKDIEEALAHVQRHSSGHSDGILTQNSAHADLFVKAIDSAAVYVNASTRFTDGGQFGLGAEVAISTQKLHARGPMGLKELTSYKWIVRGDYHFRN
jgi:glutamate-5-semialdehyde dehydrogenase